MNCDTNINTIYILFLIETVLKINIKGHPYSLACDNLLAGYMQNEHIHI